MVKIGEIQVEMSLRPKRIHRVAEICRWFGVPPHKVMDLSDEERLAMADAIRELASPSAAS